MRKIFVMEHLTMDGVIQAPGGQTEDPTGGFKFGGWSFPYGDDETSERLLGKMSRSYDLLLGRKTYEIFAAYWPFQKGVIAEPFNKATKYVVGTTQFDLSWDKTVLINKNVVNELRKLKETVGPDLMVWGSGRLLQTLLSSRLVDELHTFMVPITLGEGKKLFADGTIAQEWKMTDSFVSKGGVIIASYVPNGEVKIGGFDDTHPSEAELARRRKWSAV